MIGKNPPILCEIPVASAAPVIPSGNTAIRLKSIGRQRTMYMKKNEPL